MTITKNHVVTLNYKLHTIEENGEKVFVEETTSENPLTFLHGAGMMIPKFEENIDGLAEGEKKSFVLSPENAYGVKDPNALAQLTLDLFQESGVPPVGAVLPFSDNIVYQFCSMEAEVTYSAVVADIDHTMSGKTLNFDVEILSTRPATEEELAHGHAHGADGTETH